MDRIRGAIDSWFCELNPKENNHYFRKAAKRQADGRALGIDFAVLGDASFCNVWTRFKEGLRREVMLCRL